MGQVIDLELVRLIRQLRAEGESVASIAVKLGVEPAFVERVTRTKAA
jgi:hypothetical protein